MAATLLLIMIVVVVVVVVVIVVVDFPLNYFLYFVTCHVFDFYNVILVRQFSHLL